MSRFPRQTLLLGALISTGAAYRSAADTPPALTPFPPLVVPGGHARFDYVVPDAKMHRIFASHPEAEEMVVVDTNTNTLRQLHTGAEVNSTAVDVADNKVFFTGGGGKLFEYSRISLAPIKSLTLPAPADGMALDAPGDKLYIDEDHGSHIWVVDAKTLTLTATIPIDGDPEFIVADPSGSKIYQNIKPAAEIAVVDTATDSVVGTWSTKPATGVHGLAFDAVTKRLFSAGDNGKLAVLDATTGALITMVDIAPQVDQIDFDPAVRRLYCASRSGQISVVEETKTGARLLQNVQGAPGCHTLGVDPNDHSVWICYSDGTHAYLQAYVPH